MEKTTAQKIREWAIDRKLDVADPAKQMLKLMEEVGELANAMSKLHYPNIKDSIGDIYVVLTILAMQYSLDIEYCIDTAWEEIKNRKGKTINGVFIKEGDLQK